MRTLSSSPAKVFDHSTYLSGIGTAEVIATVASRPAPMMSATAGLEL